MTPKDIIDQTNAYRAENKLPPLKVDPQLQKAAEAMAKDMADKGYFSHITPEGKDYRTFVEASTTYQKLGQNLARGFPDATSTLQAWKGSTTHNANLTDDFYNSTGVAIVPGKNYVVQMLGTPKQVAELSKKAQPTMELKKKRVIEGDFPKPDFTKLQMVQKI